ncbi:MAG: hypothetical protein H3C52_08595 [Anaerolineales bacterium]|nr:hypothetical protein [Anaerolineales bacterium]MCZ2289216.1 hypothetical protein [Anaerolineales bacterium]
MENLKFSIFDVFAYLLPGAIVLMAIAILMTPEVKSVIEYVSSLQNINLGSGIVAILVSYLVGNVTDNFGSWLYYKIGSRIWGADPSTNKSKKINLTNAQQRALIRHYSPDNFAALQTWKILKNMSHNASFGILLISIVSFVRYGQYFSNDWLMLGLTTLICAIVLLSRASLYDRWHYSQMLETIEVLNLEQRAKNDSEKTEIRKGQKAA